MGRESRGMIQTNGFINGLGCLRLSGLSLYLLSISCSQNVNNGGNSDLVYLSGGLSVSTEGFVL